MMMIEKVCGNWKFRLITFLELKKLAGTAMTKEKKYRKKNIYKKEVKTGNYVINALSNGILEQC